MLDVSETQQDTAAQDRWKAKYFDALDEHERLERDAGSRVNELGSLIARLSRAMPGPQVHALQKRVDALHEALKRNPMDARLSRDLDDVNKRILDFMELHDQERGAVIAALDEAAGALESHCKQRKFKRELKKFRDSLQHREPPKTSELVGSLGGLQSRVFELSPASSNATSEQVDNTFDEQSSPAAAFAPQSPANNQAPSHEGPLSADPVEKQACGDAPSESITDDVPHADAAFSSSVDWPAVRGILDALIARVELSVPSNQQMEVLTQSIEGELSEVNLLFVLEQVRGLSDVALTCMNSEFRGFLDSVERRLDTLRGAFGQAREKEQAALTRGMGLADSFQASLDKMRNEAASATELTTLKSSIDVHLDDLVRSAGEIAVENRSASGERDSVLVAMSKRVEELESESKQARVQLETQRRLALTDALTGLANRKALDERMLEEVELATQRSVPLSIAIADIDHFKNVNDNYGHVAGDRALALFAGIIRKRIRAADFCARYGGEEFVMLFPSTNVQMAAQVVEDVRAFVQSCGFAYKGTPVTLTASFGVTELVADDSIASLVERADKAMYEAKASGRNRVCLL